MASSWNLAPRMAEFKIGERYDFAFCLEVENRGYGRWRMLVKEAAPSG
jgi:hypothetical protein